MYILRYMYNLVLYPAENIWRDWKLHFIFAAEKKVQNQKLMPGHALLLTMDDIFRCIVNFSEQCLVRKVAVAYFATIAECYIISAVTVAPLSAADITRSPRVGWLSVSRPRWVGQTDAQHPNVCLNFAAGCAIPCKQIGVRVLTRTLHRHRCPCSGETLVDTIDTHLHHTHTIADNVNRGREIVPIWKSRKILLSLCNDWRQRTPEATRSTL